jgi:hypothetical protein
VIDLSTIPHHHAIEDLTRLICDRSQNMDAAYFRPIVAYHLMVAAATMRAKLLTLDRGEIPVNGYVIALSTSGSGKGLSSNILENEIFGDFRKTFTTYTLPHLADASLWKLASLRSAQKGTEEQTEYDKLVREYDSTGEYIFAFDEGHPASIKQVRDKLLMAGVGSINFVVDEIGSNLTKIDPAMPVFLELYDQGLAKQKLYMNSADRKRVAQIEGKTPANMLLFGEPHRLFDGGATESLFYSLLGTGLARRTIFSLGHPIPAHRTTDDATIFDNLCDPGRAKQMQQWADHFAGLADPTKFGWTIDVPRDVGIELLGYRHLCEDKARQLPENDDLRKAELAHRYYKTLKLAGAFAFVEEALTMTKAHLHAAMKLVEESGLAFQKILNREKPYMKLARYIATCGNEVTHADLTEALPFYKSGAAARTEMLADARAWGYKQHIIIKRRFVDEVEFFSGESLEKTRLDAVSFAHSEHWAEGYTPEKAPFNQLDRLVTQPDYNFTAHAFQNEHRLQDNLIPGFDLAIFDVDGGVALDLVHELFEDLAFMTYTTKRHTPEEHRFRLILPMSYVLKLSAEDYREFMQNLTAWLPFPVDRSAAIDCARKWATNPNALVHQNEGEILDVLPFIPRTKRNEDRAKTHKRLGSLDALERWFVQKISDDGNRNNHLLRYAMSLVDQGMQFAAVETKLMALDARLPDPLGPEEIRRTVLVTVARKLQNAA